MMQIARILCPVDFSEHSRRAIDHAAAMARWYEARLVVLYVFVNLPAMDLPPPLLDDALRNRLVDDARRLAANAPLDRLEVRVREAPFAHEEILAQAQAIGADLIVMGSHGRSGFERLFLGSVTEKVIRKTTCPAMVVPTRAPGADPEAPVRFHQILCPVDFSDSAVSALTHAVSLAEESDAHLTVLNVLELPPRMGEFQLPDEVNTHQLHAAAQAHALQRLRELIPADARTYCSVETTVAEGRPYREILRCATERAADLIVMGASGRGALDHLVFGSNTQHVIRAAACPVLIARAA